MTLDQLASGQQARVSSIHGGCEIRRQLEALGIRPGDRVRMIQGAAFRGPVLVEAGGTRLAIGRGVASRVVVHDLAASERVGKEGQ